MADFQQRGEDLETNLAECKRLLEETQGRLRELEEDGKDGEKDEVRESELRKAREEVSNLQRDKKTFEELLERHRQEEAKRPWNVDTISKEGFSKVKRNISDTT